MLCGTVWRSARVVARQRCALGTRQLSIFNQRYTGMRQVWNSLPFSARVGITTGATFGLVVYLGKYIFLGLVGGAVVIWAMRRFSPTSTRNSLFWPIPRKQTRGFQDVLPKNLRDIFAGKANRSFAGSNEIENIFRGFGGIGVVSTALRLIGRLLRSAGETQRLVLELSESVLVNHKRLRAEIGDFQRILSDNVAISMHSTTISSKLILKTSVQGSKCTAGVTIVASCNDGDIRDALNSGKARMRLHQINVRGKTITIDDDDENGCDDEQVIEVEASEVRREG